MCHNDIGSKLGWDWMGRDWDGMGVKSKDVNKQLQPQNRAFLSRLTELMYQLLGQDTETNDSL